MSDAEDIVKVFLAESAENLARFDRDLVELRKHPGDRKIVADIFRTIHNIKGTSGFLAFPKLEALTQAGESLLVRLQDGQLQWNPEIPAELLAMVGAVRQMLAAIRMSGTDGSDEYRELIYRLKALQNVQPAGAAR